MMDDEVMLVETVSNKEKKSTDRQRKMRRWQDKFKCAWVSSVRNIVDGINRGRVLNLPITKIDLDNAERIWGKDMGSIIGKTTRKNHL